MEHKFNIGDVVALSTHPYSLNLLNIIISGDHRKVSPLMVVTDFFLVKISNHETIKTSVFKYRCMWFSDIENKFKEGLIVEENLKLIKKAELILSKVDIHPNVIVKFRTSSFELGKKKSSHSFTNNLSSSKSITVTSLLTYLPPLMQVLDVKEFIEKKNSGNNLIFSGLKSVHTFDVKCIYFDNKSNKISEVILPIETLDLVEIINERVIEMINHSIENNKYLQIKYPGIIERVVEPLSITFLEGNYVLNAYDFILNNTIDFEISNENELHICDSPFLNEYPKFNIIENPKAASKEYIIQEFVEAVKKAIPNNSYLRFKYKNKNDEISDRTVKNYEIIIVEEENNKKIYLSGYCLLKKAVRYFRIDRIQNLQELEVKFK